METKNKILKTVGRIPHKKVIIAVLVVTLAGGGIYFAKKKLAGGDEDMGMMSYASSEAVNGDIVMKLTGSAPLKPVNSYTVTTLTDGTVAASDFNEGDVVASGQLLYQLSGKTKTDGTAAAQRELSQAETSYRRAVDKQEQLSVKSPISGAVVSLSVKKGDTVTAGQEIAKVEDHSSLKLTVPFPEGDASAFYHGQAAEITLNGSFEKLSGTVASISSLNRVMKGNRIVRDVSINVNNPGALTETQSASAVINGAGSSGSANLKYRDSASISSDIGGKVESLSIEEGSRVSAGAQVVRLSSTELRDEIDNAAGSVQSAQQSINTQQEQIQQEMSQFMVSSPIEGTVVEKMVKTGDNVTSGKELCKIYDLSSLVFDLNVSEKEIQKVQVGQEVSITSDAVEGSQYTGTVVRVGINGTANGGLTTYPVSVELVQPEGLLPGMNVKAEIILEKAENVLMIPTAAVVRGDLVMVTEDSESAVNKTDNEAPEGFVYVPVVTGISDAENVEIKSGLVIGDVVGYDVSTDLSGYFDDMTGGGEVYVDGDTAGTDAAGDGTDTADGADAGGEG